MVPSIKEKTDGDYNVQQIPLTEVSQAISRGTDEKEIESSVDLL